MRAEGLPNSSTYTYSYTSTSTTLRASGLVRDEVASVFPRQWLTNQVQVQSVTREGI